MKSADVTASFDDEKLEALTYYLAKDKSTPQRALQNCLAELYEKYVPADTREYLERKSAPAVQRPRRPVRSAAPKSVTKEEPQNE